MKLTEKTISQTNIYSGRIINVSVDDVELPNGEMAKRELVAHSGGACVVAVDDNQEILFIRQFRYPFKEILLELPAGKLEKGQTPLQNCIRELKEETGAIGRNYVSLGTVYPTVGYCNEVIHIFMCQIDSIGTQNLDKDEFLNVEKIHIDKALDMVMNNQIPDAKTQIGILKASILLQKERDKSQCNT